MDIKFHLSAKLTERLLEPLETMIAPPRKPSLEQVQKFQTAFSRSLGVVISEHALQAIASSWSELYITVQGGKFREAIRRSLPAYIPLSEADDPEALIFDLATELALWLKGCGGSVVFNSQTPISTLTLINGCVVAHLRPGQRRQEEHSRDVHA